LIFIGEVPRQISNYLKCTRRKMFADNFSSRRDYLGRESAVDDRLGDIFRGNGQIV
jgi:hypothetical protein